MGMTRPEQRRSPRAAVELPCTLTRHRGNPITAVTLDLGAGGMRVRTDRPLATDEAFEFDLRPDAPDHRHGRARVVRQQAPQCYALRFDEQMDGIVEWAESA